MGRKKIHNRPPRPKRQKGVTVPGTNTIIQREYPGQDPSLTVKPDPRPDIEKELPTPKDAISKHKYPPPKKHPVFRKTWAAFIDNITMRENFKVGHLGQLEILCDLHVDYEDLREFLRINGRSYQSYGRGGMVWKFFPEVNQLNNVQAQIKEYMKLMGLTLKKDHSGQSGGEKDEWT